MRNSKIIKEIYKQERIYTSFSFGQGSGVYNSTHLLAFASKCLGKGSEIFRTFFTFSSFLASKNLDYKGEYVLREFYTSGAVCWYCST